MGLRLLLIREAAPHYIRVRGLNKDGMVLGESDAWDWRQEMVALRTSLFFFFETVTNKSRSGIYRP